MRWEHAAAQKWSFVRPEHEGIDEARGGAILNDVPADELGTGRRAGGTVAVVRNSDACAVSRVPDDAQRLPLSIPPVRVQDLPRMGPIVTCQSDVRSTQVALVARRAGLPVAVWPQ